MTKITSFDLAPFYRNSIGVDRLFNRIIDQFDHAAQTNYPPYNIIETNENTYEIQIAVAGFSQGEITIKVDHNELVISGEKTDREDNEGRVYRHQGISARKFIRSFALGEYVEVTNAVAKDGILTVVCERHIPEAMKPKTIAITYAN